MNMMYELIIAQKKAKEASLMTEIGGLKVKPKYQYDSDEDTEGGTWEHKKRQVEMEATRGIFLPQYCVHKIVKQKYWCFFHLLKKKKAPSGWFQFNACKYAIISVIWILSFTWQYNL